MNFLKQYRNEYKLTQKETALQLNMTLRRYLSYEQGTRITPEVVFIEILKNWKTYPNRTKIIQSLEWYEENKRG